METGARTARRPRDRAHPKQTRIQTRMSLPKHALHCFGRATARIQVARPRASAPVWMLRRIVWMGVVRASKTMGGARPRAPRPRASKTQSQDPRDLLRSKRFKEFEESNAELRTRREVVPGPTWSPKMMSATATGDSLACSRQCAERAQIKNEKMQINSALVTDQTLVKNNQYSSNLKAQ